MKLVNGLFKQKLIKPNNIRKTRGQRTAKHTHKGPGASYLDGDNSGWLPFICLYSPRLKEVGFSVFKQQVHADFASQQVTKNTCLELAASDSLAQIMLIPFGIGGLPGGCFLV